MTTTTCYLLYLIFSLVATAFASVTLARTGSTLQRTSLAADPLVRAGNRLVVLAFTLTNLGWIAFQLLPRSPLNALDQQLQFETDKCGLVLLVLGLTGFLSVFALTRVGRLVSSLPVEAV